MRLRPLTGWKRACPQGQRSKCNAVDYLWRQPRLKQFQTPRQARRLRRKLRRPPSYRRVRASVHASEFCPTQREDSRAAPSRSAHAHELFLQARFFGEIPELLVHQRTCARPDREIPLPAFLRSLPFAESRSPLRQSCSTNDLAAAQKCCCKQAVARRVPLALLPNAAHDVLLLLPCAKECLCVFRHAPVPPGRDTFVRSRLPPANCALRRRLFAEDFFARGPCRI